MRQLKHIYRAINGTMQSLEAITCARALMHAFINHRLTILFDDHWHLASSYHQLTSHLVSLGQVTFKLFTPGHQALSFDTGGDALRLGRQRRPDLTRDRKQL